jgi:hypothetical protein
MSILAVVAKSIFEKDARAGGKLAGIGGVWPTARYASTSPALEPLAGGGALYLVTVRPGDQLWLVAVLRAPTRDASGWTSPPNTVPIRDISALRPKLRFASGKGITAEPGKLGMSLQTPRVLAETDVALLDAAAAPVAEPNAAGAAPGPRDVPESRGLVLGNYRRRARWGSLTAAEKKILAPVEDELASADEEEGEDTFELIDVVDAASAASVYLLALWPFGSGVLVDLTKKKVVADVAQHHFDARGDGELRVRLAAAWERQRASLGVREMVSFTPGQGEDERPKAKEGSLLERIEAFRAALREGIAADQKALWALVCEAIDFTAPRPPRARRLFELDEPTRAALELIHEGYDASATNLGRVGLPVSLGSAWRKDPAQDPGALARFLGHAASGPLDVPVAFEGAEHPAWCLVGDAVDGVRSHEEVLAALATLSSSSSAALLRALVLPAASGLVIGGYAPPPEGAQPGSPAARGAHAQRYLRFLMDFARQVGEPAVQVAKEILATRADWLERWLPQLTTRPQMSVPHWFEQCNALGVLASAAKSAGSALDPSRDELLSALARYQDATYPLAVVLEALPAERAARIACADLALIERFPSAESAAAAVERFEASGGGAYMEALFKRVVVAIGAPARPALEAAIERASPQERVLVRCLALVGKR